jgi:hypothetical protein
VGVKDYVRRERKRGKTTPNDLMPLTRLGTGYLYANMSYGRTSILHRKLAKGRKVKTTNLKQVLLAIRHMVLYKKSEPWNFY